MHAYASNNFFIQIAYFLLSTLPINIMRKNDFQKRSLMSFSWCNNFEYMHMCV